MSLKNFIIFSITFVISFQAPAVNKSNITNLIEPIEYFVNHDLELENLSKKLSVYKKIGLIGNSGMGKTQLARKYAKYHESRYKIIWVFDCNTNLNEQYLELIRLINSELIGKGGQALGEDINQAKINLMNFLTSKKDWLLIFDNLKIGQNNKVQDILEWENNGHVIICSQEAKGINETIKLPYFKKEDALALATHIMDPTQIEVIEELAETFKGYPIMIAQGAFFLKKNKYITIEEYKKTFSGGDNKVMQHIKLALSKLSDSAKETAYRIALINNQNFSKGLLKMFISNKNSFSEDLHNLVNYGLISNTGVTSEGTSRFEMHDVIKEIILASLEKEEIKAKISVILKAINQNKEGIIDIRHEFYNDPTLLSNFEVILNNAEIYQASVYDVMELRKNLIMYYTSQSDFENWRKMGEWLETQEEKKLINFRQMNDNYKNIYAWFLIYRGLYREFTAGDFIGAIKDFNLATEIAEAIPSDVKLKFFIYTNLAQIQLYRGDLINGAKNLENSWKLFNSDKGLSKDNSLDKALILYMDSLLSLELGNYTEALNVIEQSIKFDEGQDLPSDPYTMASFILKAEILVRMENFIECFNLASKLYEQSKTFAIIDYEQQARILTWLASAELNTGKIDQALIHIGEAKKCLEKIPARLQQNIADSIDFDLAEILIVEGNIFAVKSDLKEALESYLLAEKIYNNRYGNNLKLDRISILLTNITKVAKLLNKPDILNRYKDKHEKIFGLEHFRTKKIFKDFLNILP